MCNLDGCQKLSWAAWFKKKNATRQHVPWGQLPFDEGMVSQSTPMMRSRTDVQHFSMLCFYFNWVMLDFGCVMFYTRLFLSRGMTHGINFSLLIHKLPKEQLCIVALCFTIDKPVNSNVKKIYVLANDHCTLVWSSYSECFFGGAFLSTALSFAIVMS